MNEFRLKDNIREEDFMIHVLNNLPKEYEVPLDGLEHHLTLSGDDALTFNFTWKNWTTGAKKQE